MAEYENIIDLNRLGRFHNNLKDKGLPLNDWQANKEYKVDCTVIQDGKLYRCKTEHTSTTTFDDTKWSVVSSSGIPYYTSNTSYKVDDQVVYDNSIYRCVTAHTSTATFDDTKWEELSSGGGISIWQANTEYKVNDVVIDSNLIWQCVVAHTSSTTFDESKWEEISGGGIFAWKSNKNYKVGIMVVYKYCIYMCKVAHISTSEFDYSKWIIISGNGNGDFGDYVGHITWQMSLQSNYLKLDGTPLANASNDYDEILKYAQDNNLITEDTTDKSLFKYDITTDVLTLPDYVGLCLQGGNIIEEKEAGLPNIDGGVHFRMAAILGGTDTGAFKVSNTSIADSILENSGSSVNVLLDFDASRSNSIYGNSTTVQPPAIQLIPQIRYKYSGCVYSTEEQRIGTWIDGKPLYQKTFVINNVPTPTSPYSTGLSSDYCNIVYMNCLIVDGAHNYLQLGFNSVSSIIQYYINVSTGNFMIETSDPNITIVNLIVQYTKTTD